jgi:ribosomal protein L32E
MRKATLFERKCSKKTRTCSQKWTRMRALITKMMQQANQCHNYPKAVLKQ